MYASLFALTLLTLTGHHATPAAAQQADPVAVAQAYIAAANSGDFDAALAFYADDAVVRNPLGLFVGRDAIAGWLRQDVQTTRATPADFQQINGETVINTGTVRLQRFADLGIEQVAYRSEYLIRQGKIIFFAPTTQLTPEQQATVQAVAPPAAPAVDPVDVVTRYIAAANSGDSEAAFAFYAEGAVVKNPLGLFVGRDAIGGWLRQDVQGTRATPQSFTVINGGTTVINTGTVALARFTALGIDQVGYRSEYLIEGDKIRYFAPTVQLTPEQLAIVQATSSGSSGGQTTTPARLPNTGPSPGMEPLFLIGRVVLGLLSGALRLRHWR